MENGPNRATRHHVFRQLEEAVRRVDARFERMAVMTSQCAEGRESRVVGDGGQKGGVNGVAEPGFAVLEGGQMGTSVRGLLCVKRTFLLYRNTW